MTNWRAISVVCCSTLLTISCAPGADDTSAIPNANLLSVREAWARPADSGATTAMYFVLANDGAEPDTLIGVSTNDAELAELHISMQHDGMMHMTEVTSLPVPATDSVSFRPLGAHVMLTRVRAPLTEGDSVTATLRFVSGRALEVRAGVRKP